MRKINKKKHLNMEGQLDIFRNHNKESMTPVPLETIIENDNNLINNNVIKDDTEDKSISIKEVMKEAEQEITKAKEKIKDYQNFGITPKLIGQLPYITVREMFYGINNMHDNYTFWSGKEFKIGRVYEKMNPTEILAFWTAIGRKTNTYHNIVNQRNFVDTMSKLVALGHDIPSISISAPEYNKGTYNIGTVHGRAKKNTDIYSTGPYEMKKRLNSIDESVISEVTDQLKRPGRYTEKEKNTCYANWNYDGNNILTDPNSYSKGPTHAAKMEYVDIIMNITKAVYDNHIKYH